jgi:inhibitor of nuclear factor kappa-B kinase subunit epsilon
MELFVSLLACLLSPPKTPLYFPPSRFSPTAGTSEIQELKGAAELRSRLRTVSELGAGTYQGQTGGQSPELRTSGGVYLLAPQLAEVLSRCSQNITDTQMSLSNLSSELMKNRDQVHEDRRSVGFP